MSQPSTEGVTTPVPPFEEGTNTTATTKAKAKSQQKKPTKSKKDRTPSPEKYDYQRAEGPDMRDGRAQGYPCFGQHVAMAEGRGSLSGRNKHGRWTVCSQCRLRIQYVPAYGATAAHRQAGPLGPDSATVVSTVKGKIEEDPLEKEKLNSKPCSSLAAEVSLRQRLEKLEADRKKKPPQLRPGENSKAAPSTPPATAQGYVTEVTKKAVKRESEKTAEKAEAEWETVNVSD